MRVRGILVLAALLAPTGVACQLVDPESDLGDDGDAALDAGRVDAAADATVADAAVGVEAGGSADAGIEDGSALSCADVDAFLCDTFDTDGLVSKDDEAHVDSPNCSTGTLLVTGGQLVIEHAMDDGTSFEECAFVADPTGSISGFSLDFDFSFQLSGAYDDAMAMEPLVISSVKMTLASPDDAGVMDIDYQLLVDSQGSAQLIALPYYPATDDYVSYNLSDLYSPAVWIPQGTRCHVSLQVSALVPSGTAVAICNGQTVALNVENTHPPAGFRAPATLTFGYFQPQTNMPWAGWSLTYDNVVFRVTP